MKKSNMMKKIMRSLAAAPFIINLLIPAQFVLAVAPPPATYSIAITSAVTTDLGVAISGTASATNFNGNISNYDVSVNWGDATTSSTSTHSFVAAGSNFSGTWSNSHTYSTAGSYTITVSLNNSNTSKATASTIVNPTAPVTPPSPPPPPPTPPPSPSPPPPTYSISIDSASVTDLDVDISGTASATNYNGNVNNYDVSVDWGDSTTSSTSTHSFVAAGGDFSGTWSNSHTYTTAGTYTITVSLDNSNTSKATDSELVNPTAPVTPPSPPPTPPPGPTPPPPPSPPGPPDPVYSISIDNVVTNDLDVSIDGVASASDFPGQASQFDVSVDWGDGNTVTTSTHSFPDSDPSNGTWSNSHTYTTGGSYTITVNLDRNNTTEASDSTGVEITAPITPPSPPPSPTPPPPSPPGPPDPVYFISIDNIFVNGMDVNIDGVASASDFPGQSSQFDVFVDWGDGNTVDTSTHSFPDSDPFEGTWSNSHTYTSGGSYSISAVLYRGQISGNDANDTADVEIVDIVGPPPPPPPAPSAVLIVIKNVVNDDGGEGSASNFTMNVTGTDVSDSSFPGSSGEGTTVTLSPGEYSVDEDEAAGYEKSLSEDCSGTIADGEIRTCTITNDDIAPKLTVIKLVVNEFEGTADVSDFPLFVDETSVTSGETNEFSAGEYTVSETNLPGYTGSFSGDCDSEGGITLALGDDKTCTITNSDSDQGGDDEGGGDEGEGGGDNPPPPPPSPEPTPPPSGNGGGAGGRASNYGGPGQPGGDSGEVLGETSEDVWGWWEDEESDGEVLGDTACGDYLTGYIRYGANNNPNEVTKLQLFLNAFMGSGLSVNGFYDLFTFNAVKAFQLQEAAYVLKPWGITQPTGFVYIYTKKRINELYCIGGYGTSDSSTSLPGLDTDTSGGF